MSSLDQKQLDRLFALLVRAVNEKDEDSRAALRWAIFTLEQVLK